MFVVYVEKSLLKEIREGKLTDSGNGKVLTNAASGLIHKTFPLARVKRYKCHICDKAFAVMADLKQHYMIHTGEKPFECEICGKCFNKKSSVVAHSLIHAPRTSFDVQIRKCPGCGKEFKTASGLNRHNRKHHIGNIKLPKCELCNKEFSEKAALKQHYMTHTGEKPFECENCGKQFSKKSRLELHFKTHYSNKSLKCLECGKEFKTKRGLANHQRKPHVNTEVYPCEFCDKVFNDRFKLKRHHLSHTGKKNHMNVRFVKIVLLINIISKHILRVTRLILIYQKYPEYKN